MIYNTGMIKFKNCHDEYGHLTPIEANRDIPFEIKRIYYVSKVSVDARRGFHAHRMLHQVLICVSGSVSILIKANNREEVVILSDSTEGLYIGPMVWREMFDFKQDAVLLVLASNYYDENDYIRNYEEYNSIAQSFFK